MTGDRPWQTGHDAFSKIMQVFGARSFHSMPKSTAHAGAFGRAHLLRHDTRDPRRAQPEGYIANKANR